jgi:hypothetical protein
MNELKGIIGRTKQFQAKEEKPSNGDDVGQRFYLVVNNINI